MKPNILLVDDDPATLFLFSEHLSGKGYDVREARCLAEARAAISSRQYNAVILDMILPDGNGIDWIAELRGTSPEIAIIVITGVGDIPIAVEAMRRGADNFLSKPVNMAELDVFLRKSLELQALRQRDLTNRRLKKRVQVFFGDSETMREVKEFAFNAAKNKLPVLIQGETGTGKSLLARWIHEHSYCFAAPFVEVSCSILKGDLLASELFGHVKGSFTSAVQDSQGLIEAADGGTLFLDEIGDMDPSVQAQFLKVLEEKEYRRLGEVKIRRSDFRLICATNKNLNDETKQGRFRQDLYFRINTFPIVIPPLRERPEDLIGLSYHFLFRFGSHYPDISREVLSLLEDYQWPGNIRELRNVLERAFFLANSSPLRPDHFRGLETAYPREDNVAASIGNLDRMEEEHIKNVIARSGGDMRKAASILGVSKSTLYRKLQKFQKPL